MMIRNTMMASAAPFSPCLRAPDDGAGASAPGVNTATATDGHNGVGAVGNVAGASAVAGVVKDASGAPADRTDNSFDGLRARVAALETENDKLSAAVAALEDAATGSGRGSADAAAIRRLEHVLADAFGRELAEYDAQQRANPPTTVTGG